MMDRQKLFLTKLCVNALGYITFLTMICYMIPIVMTFELNVYDMAIITKLFVICMTCLFIFISYINSILNKYNNISIENGYKNYIKEMIDIRHTLGAGNTMIELLILFFVAVLITYAAWWWKADIYPLEAAIYYIILLIGAIVNLSTIIKYMNKFTFFDERLHNEVYK